MKKIVCRLACLLFTCLFYLTTQAQQVLKVGVAGLNHDHVLGLMNQYKKGEVIIAGIAEPDRQLIEKYKLRFGLPDSLFYKSVKDMLKHIKPDAVLAYNATADHLDVVEACAPKHISVMVEKPLAITFEDAQEMEKLAKRYNIQVLTNYETTWYPTSQQIFQMVHAHTIGDVQKMVVHDGHQGPVEIGCSPDFLKWLTDPEKNGAGALYDFGCYGANLMTWLMDNKTPVAVTAVTRHVKPATYPKADDDATILVDYGTSMGIIEASWNWPFGIKDFEVFGKTGYLHALNGNTLQQRDTVVYYNVPVQPYIYKNNIAYLTAVLRGDIQPGNDLSSLNNNLVVVRILEAARESAKSGKKVVL
jgi:predicted dehydrogenase